MTKKAKKEVIETLKEIDPINDLILTVDYKIKELLEAKESVTSLFKFQIKNRKTDLKEEQEQLNALNDSLNLSDNPKYIRHLSNIADERIAFIKGSEKFIEKHSHNIYLIKTALNEKLEKLSKERRQLITKEQGQKNNNTFPTSEELYQKIFVNTIKQKLSKRELSYQLDKTSPLKERYSYLINSIIYNEEFNYLMKIVHILDSRYMGDSLKEFIPKINQAKKTYHFFEYLKTNHLKKELKLLKKINSKDSKYLPEKPSSRKKAIVDKILPFIHPKNAYTEIEFSTLLTSIGFEEKSTKQSLIDLNFIKKEKESYSLKSRDKNAKI